MLCICITQSQLLEEKTRELSDCRDQLEVAREAEEEYERRLDEEQAQNKKKIQELEVMIHSHSPEPRRPLTCILPQVLNSW